MKHFSYSLFRYKSGVVFILTFFFTALVGLLITAYLETNRYQRAQSQASDTIELMAGRLSHTIDLQLSLTYTLKALVEKANGDIDSFKHLLPELIGETNAENISLAPNGIVEIIYPLEGNEATIKHNLLKDPARSTGATLAKDSRKLTLSGPYALLQGGNGIIGRLPIYLKDGPESDYFWGFTCVAIAIPSGLEDAHLDSLSIHGYSYELSAISSDTDESQIIMQSTPPLLHTPKEKIILLPNSEWVLRIAPTLGWINYKLLCFELIVVILFSLISSFLAYNLLHLADRKKELSRTVEQQSSNYKQLNQLNEDLRVFRHDMTNHMISLTSLLAKQEWDASREYIQYISGTLLDTSRIINTENYVFDALISTKINEARKKGIHVDLEISITKKLLLKNEDWCILYGNALDNAIESCLLSHTITPELLIKIFNHGNILQTVITNTNSSLEELPLVSGSTSKWDKQNHGFGLRQIQSVVKKYKGIVDISTTYQYFTLSFTLFDV